MSNLTDIPMTTKPLTSPPRAQLTQNAIFWPAAGVYLKSRHTHDFTGHTMVIAGVETSLFLDGGLDYRRVVSSGNPVYEDFCLWSDSPFEEVCRKLLWGTYGPKGDQPRRWVPLKECETDHLQAILRTQLHIYGGVVERVIKHILKERGVKPAALEIPGLGPIPEDIPVAKPPKKAVKKPFTKQKAKK